MPGITVSPTPMKKASLPPIPSGRCPPPRSPENLSVGHHVSPAGMGSPFGQGHHVLRLYTAMVDAAMMISRIIPVNAGHAEDGSYADGQDQPHAR